MSRLINPRKFTLLSFVLAFIFISTLNVYAQSSAFTYQGSLTDGGTPTNGNYDLQFSLWNSNAGGNQVGATQTLNNVTVSDGIFSVSLDFGSNAFPGTARYLEIAARRTGDAQFTTLTPRQEITSTPYAQRSGTASSADNATNSSQLGGVNANQFVQTNDARLTNSRPPTAGSDNYIRNADIPQLANFWINGFAIVNGNLSGKTVEAYEYFRLNGTRVMSNPGVDNIFVGADTGNGPTVGQRNTTVGTKAALLNTGSDNSFFGYSAGVGNTGSRNLSFGANSGANNQGDDNSFFGFASGVATTTGGENSFFGRISGGANKTGSKNAFFGSDTGNTNVSGSSLTLMGYKSDVGSAGLTNATAIGANARVDQNNTIVLGGIFNVNGATADTRVGIGTTTPSEKLTVRTPTANYGLIHTDDTTTIGTYVNSSGGFVGTRSNHSLHLLVNGATRLTIDTAGVVRIPALGAAGSTAICRNASNQISTCSSSLRYKSNVHTFTGGLNVVQRLRPITFDWKEGGLHDVGFGAEEVAAVEPLLTFRNENNEIEGVKYSQISVVLVNAIKEQQAQIQKQEAVLLQQQRQIDQLVKLIKAKQKRRR